MTFRADSAALIGRCNSIISEYLAQGFVLTLRQLYYQLVSRDVIPNVERSYKNLSSLVSNARLAGLMDWDAIEDRGRQPKLPNEFDNLEDLVKVALASYRLPRWKTQDNYVELWVEKDALAGVLAPIAHQWHITLSVNKGYSSVSAMRQAALRFLLSFRAGKSCHLIYLGDHDPSGEDMVRDIRDRMAMFGAHLEVDKVALTMRQVTRYSPPPNPAKVTDPRADAYIKKFGDKSWEVDALPPEVLRRVIEGRLEELVDPRAMERIKAEEQLDKQQLRDAVRSIMESKPQEDDDEYEASTSDADGEDPDKSIPSDDEGTETKEEGD